MGVYYGGGGHGLINTTLLARPVTRSSSLGLSSCGLIHVYLLSVSFSYLHSAAGVSFDIKKARRRPYSVGERAENQVFGVGNQVLRKPSVMFGLMREKKYCE